MSRVEGLAVAAVAAVIVYLVAKKYSASSSSSSSSGIDPATGGVRLPTPATYGPPKPIVNTGAEPDAFMN